MTEEESKTLATLPAPMKCMNTYNFSKMGFVGDTDDFEEDDIEQNMAGNYDWMF